jgi:hypothetical protein
MKQIMSNDKKHTNKPNTNKPNPDPNFKPDTKVHTPEPPQVMDPSAQPKKNTQSREEVRKKTHSQQGR